jgi:hypothetical protein
MPLTGGGRYGFGGSIDLNHAAVQQQPDLFVTGVVIAGRCQLLAFPVFGVAGEPHPVIRRVGFLGEHGDPPGSVHVAGAQRLNESVAHHAVSDHDDFANVAVGTGISASHSPEAREGVLRKCFGKLQARCDHVSQIADRR